MLPSRFANPNCQQIRVTFSVPCQMFNPIFCGYHQPQTNQPHPMLANPQSVQSLCLKKKSSSKIYLKKWLYNPWSGPNPKTCCFGPSQIPMDPTCDVAIMAIPRRQGQLRRQLLRVTVSPRRRQASMAWPWMVHQPKNGEIMGCMGIPPTMSTNFLEISPNIL